MLTYVTTTDGETYKAESPLHFVRQLKDSSFSGADLTLNEFMRETAARTERDTGFKIKPHNAARFVEGLLRAGLVKEQIEKPE